MTLAAFLADSRARLAGLALAFCAVLLLGAGSASAQLVEGKNYDRIKNPQPTESGNKIEVIEFFSYGCPHCAELEPFLETWLAKLPPDVAFRRVPVMFQDRWIPLAKFAVNGKMNRARQQAQQYNIQSVPTVVVDGKFITGSERVGTHAQLPAAIDELISKARAERKK
jgi:protein-disulfide isomerase